MSTTNLSKHDTNLYMMHMSAYSTHKLIADRIGTGNVILDVGCNEGYLKSISQKNNKFFGLDYMPETVAKAKKIYEDVLVYDLNNLQTLPWKQKFDLIIFADVLEHVLYPDQVLSYFYKNYLKPNGKIIISVPNIANWRFRIKLLFGNFDYTDTGILDKTHLHLYTYKSALKLAQAVNTEVIEFAGSSSIFGAIMKYLPFTKTFLAIDIIMILADKKHLNDARTN